MNKTIRIFAAGFASALALLLLTSATPNFPIDNGFLQSNLSGTDPFTGTHYGLTNFLSFQLVNATSGSITIQAPTGALGTPTVTVPATTGTLMEKTTTDVMQNKTMDTASSNTFKRFDYIQLDVPDYGDNTGAVRITTDGATYGHFTMSNSAAKTANYIVYRFRVPDNLNTAIDLAAVFTFRLVGADTNAHVYTISMADCAQSATCDAPTYSNEITFTYSGDAAGAANDMEQTNGGAYTTLTTWKSSLTAGHMMSVKVARDGSNAGDTSTVNSTDMNLTIRYGTTSNGSQ